MYHILCFSAVLPDIEEHGPHLPKIPEGSLFWVYFFFLNSYTIYVYFFLGRVQSRIKKDTLEIPIFSTIICAKNQVNVLKTFCRVYHSTGRNRIRFDDL